MEKMELSEALKANASVLEVTDWFSLSWIQVSNK
jgi:hypothetical protein